MALLPPFTYCHFFLNAPRTSVITITEPLSGEPLKEQIIYTCIVMRYPLPPSWWIISWVVVLVWSLSRSTHFPAYSITYSNRCLTKKVGTHQRNNSSHSGVFSGKSWMWTRSPRPTLRPFNTAAVVASSHILFVDFWFLTVAAPMSCVSILNPTALYKLCWKAK